MYYYFGKWRGDGTDQAIHDLLRRRVRESRGRHEDPSAIVMDAQTVHASGNALKETTELDPGQRSRGRKRGIATDVRPAHRRDRGRRERSRQRDLWHAGSLVRDGRLHDARHTAGTVLMLLGVPDRVIDQITGWEPGGAARMRARYFHVPDHLLKRWPGRSGQRSGEPRTRTS